MVVVAHADAGPVGSVVVTTSPVDSMATQSVVEGQAMDWGAPSANVVAVHADCGPVGSVEVRTPPAAETTHSVADGHATAPRIFGWANGGVGSIWTGAEYTRGAGAACAGPANPTIVVTAVMRDKTPKVPPIILARPSLRCPRTSRSIMFPQFSVDFAEYSVGG
jgi:hypothetical protein